MTWPYTLPFEFPGGDAVPSRLDGEYAASILESHCSRGIKRLIDKYKGKPRIEAILCAVLDQVEEAEVAAHDLIRADTIFTGLDDQLDRDGKVVGAELRGAIALDRYRKIVLASILVLKSDGMPEEIASILRVLYPDNDWSFFEIFPAAFRVDMVAEAEESKIVYRLLYRAKKVGIRLHLVWTEDPDNAFTFSSTNVVETSSTLGFGDTDDPSTGGLLAGTY